ncbi:hypothetical protein JH06_0745 [Blastocystis sp. subtype 4]|uniref:hypothetical protein n=1 Tax=Blastocystis sp. subtype 4 TaxID=944170 RepID=UPI000712211F|nr:hypothetical protein JH06_0745 [Blastocystis sp. subtype 4]KNB45707.1 hypothetical protein JH06_0745 [Blastocystis sp. subtype 4]|eukprot:XP_014529150.1 hypothetical protein JH06_0745 [Blastocystis sp. subtype 4]
MADMHYDQYGTPLGYSSREKLPVGYSNRTMSSSRYNTSAMGNSSQNRALHQQGMGVWSSSVGDRGMAMSAGDDMDGGYTYGTIQSGRGNVQSYVRGSQKGSDLDSKGMNTPQSRPTVPMGSNSYIPKLASADRISDEMKEKQIFYKLYAGVAFGRVDPVQNFNYVLSPNYSFPSPKVSVNHIHTFSTSLLLYIFYSMPRDVLQVEE